MKNKLLQDLTWRGLIYDCTDIEALDELLNTESITLYCGFIQPQKVFMLVLCYLLLL